MIRGAEFFISFEDLSGYSYSGPLFSIGASLQTEDRRGCVENLLLWAGCSERAVLWLDSVRETPSRRGMEFLFCSNAEETMLPLCAPGCSFKQVTIDDLNRYCGSSYKLARNELVNLSPSKTYRRVIDRE